MSSSLPLPLFVGVNEGSDSATAAMIARSSYSMSLTISASSFSTMGSSRGEAADTGYGASGCFDVVVPDGPSVRLNVALVYTCYGVDRIKMI